MEHRYISAYIYRAECFRRIHEGMNDKSAREPLRRERQDYSKLIHMYVIVAEIAFPLDTLSWDSDLEPRH